ncbi:hypothetical protein [Viridibacillus sp. FSL H8-0110]|uniref:hypothetical protein n=1 Tax=Viridibacillus sp. FSL H8-0110 TaxID=2921376 RepID=UPI0030FBBB66
MEKVHEKLKELDSGEEGIEVYSQFIQRMILSINSDLSVSLASSSKLIPLLKEGCLLFQRGTSFLKHSLSIKAFNMNTRYPNAGFLFTHVDRYFLICHYVEPIFENGTQCL